MPALASFTPNPAGQVANAARLFALLAAALAAGCGSGGGATYEADIQRTSFGVPHIYASNLGSAAYGVAYAYAQDNLCLLADQILTVSGERSRNHGPDTPVRAGSTLTNLKSDLVYRFLLDETAQRALYAGVSAEAKQLIAGYVAGYNRYVRERAGNLPAPCAGATWVRPMTELDLYRLLSGQATQSGYGAFLAGLHDAEPPTGATPLAAALTPSQTAQRLAAALAALPDRGSNAYAIGRDATDNGSGLLLGNPHFPWSSTSRFYQFHVSVPGSFDVMGAALGGIPIPVIGFNRDMAWSHTVSTGRRFTLFELTLQDGTSYSFDGATRKLTKKTVSVEVKNADGSLSTRSRDFYSSHHGPIVVGSGLAWSLNKAFAIKDVNADNSRMLDQWLALGRATTAAEVQQAARSFQGLPWVNTLAADRQGNAFYGDLSATPNVSAAKLAACATSPTAQALLAARTYVLDGSKASCEWDVDSATGRALLLPAAMPQLLRTDYVSNSNDSGWLANPAQPAAEFSPLIGFGAREQSLRSRLAFRQIADRLSGADGKGGNRFNPANLESIFFDNRHHAAELTLDALLALCQATPRANATSGNSVGLAPACATLAAWNRRLNLDAVGVPLFREFWRSARNIPSLWSVPFSASDPVNTPRGLNTGNATVAAALLRALADSVERLAANGVALNAPLRQVQYVSAGSTRIPIDGGDEFEGPFNKMTPASGLTAAGYTPIVSGSSYIQAVTFDAAGPVARGILTYSQSTDPTSPHYADQTAQYASGRWVKLPYSAADVRADPNWRQTVIAE